MRAFRASIAVAYGVIACMICAPLAAVQINEVMSSNGGVVTDTAGDAPDWIELYNSGDNAVSLLSWGLSDDPDRPFQWVFPNVEIAPGGFLIVWASGEGLSPGSDAVHTNFAISRAGATLALTKPDDVLADSVAVPELPRNVSWGRQPDGSATWRYFDEPTPGSANTRPGYVAVLDPPQFSHAPGRYPEAITVTVTGEPDAVLRYTVDGSIPDEHAPVLDDALPLAGQTGEPYRYAGIFTAGPNEPFEPPEGEVRQAHTLRVRAFREDALSSPVATATYFVGSEYTDPFELPVVSLVTGPDGFFDREVGIYGARQPDASQASNFWRRGREWERRVHVSYFSEAGDPLLEQDAGVRIHGGLTRGYQVKSLRLYARRDYGERWFDHPFFGDDGMPRYRRILLRTSGNDSSRGTLFRDAFIHRLVGHMRFDTQAYMPAILFINGEYWGIHNLRERYDRHYLSQGYDVPEDNIDLLTANSEVKEGEGGAYEALLDLLEDRGPDDPELAAEVEARMDVDNYLDYVIAEIFLNNTDWPHSNIDYWRTRGLPPGRSYRPEHDGRWRWLFYDLDFGYNLWYDRESGFFSHTFNTLAHATAPEQSSMANPPWSTFLLRSVLGIRAFRDRFLNRYADHLNTTFRTDRAHRIMEEMADRMRLAVPEHTRRYPALLSEESWERSLEHKRIFAVERPGIAWAHLLEHFDISGTVILELHVSDRSGGTVLVNDHLLLHPDAPGFEETNRVFPWTGRYFRGVPIRVEALPAPGYRFEGWADTPGSDPVRSLTLDGDRVLAAVFIPDEEADVAAHPLSEGPYSFAEWSPDAPVGSYPPFMQFVESSWPDPDLRAPLTGVWTLPYNLNSRSRVVGLDEEGVGFRNTSNPQPDDRSGYVAGAKLAVDTRRLEAARLAWTAGTASPADRRYRWRLQYRVLGTGDYVDFPDGAGEPVEVWSADEPWARTAWNGLEFPEELLGQAHVELLWRYASFDDGASGPRPELFLADVRVTGEAKDVPDLLPEGAFWRSFDYRGDNFFSAPWFGRVFAGHSPWFYHELHGWLYAYPSNGDAPPWWWDPKMGFVWTAPGLYPHLYAASGGWAGWFFYRWGTQSPREVYSYEENRWIAW